MHRNSVLPIWFALVVVAACQCSQPKEEWLQNQETQIGTAVLLDVVQQEEARGAPVVCVGIAKDPGSPRADPPPAILASLRNKNARTYPVSECDVSEAGVRHRTAGGGVLIGVGRPELRGSDLARTTGWLFIANFNARSWTYTLNRHNEEWTVATAKLEAVS